MPEPGTFPRLLSCAILQKHYESAINPTTVPAGKQVTLDLNGKTITAESGGAALLNQGTLTINGQGNVKGDSYYAVLNHGEKLTINGGNYSKTGTQASLISNGWYTASDNTSGGYSEMVINGGSFDGGAYTAIKNDSYGKMTITGGSFTSTLSSGGIQETGSELTITGGTFDASVLVSNMSSVQDETKTVKITGGAFNKPVVMQPYNGSVTKASEVDVFVGSAAQINSSFALTNTYSTAGTNAFVLKQFDVKNIGGSLTLGGTSDKPLPAVSLDGMTINGGVTLSYVAPSNISNTTVKGSAGIKAGNVTLENVTAPLFTFNATDATVTIGDGTNIAKVAKTANAGAAVVVDGGSVGTIESTGTTKNMGCSSITVVKGTVESITTSKGDITINGGMVESITIVNKYVTSNPITITINDASAVGTIDNQREGNEAATVETNIVIADKDGEAVKNDDGSYSIQKKELSIAPIEDVDYNGKPQEPEITVTYGTADPVTLQASDYDAVYSNNTDATDKAKVEVTGKGDYAGKSASATFVINQMSMRNAFSGITAKDSTFTGFAQTPELTFKDNKNKVVEVSDDEYTLRPASETNAGDYSVQIVGAEKNYFGTDSANWTINPADFADVKVTLSPTSYVFGNESKYEPAVTAKLTTDAGTYTLEEGTDYTVAYEDNEAAGTGKVIVTPAGDNFTGEPITKTFNIKAAVAKVDETYYPTLSAAIGAVKGTKGKTVELLQDQDLSGIFNRFTLGEGTEFTLDLGGHTLLMNGAYFTLNGGKLTVTNGAIEAKGNMSQEFTVNSGELNVTESATIKGTGNVSPIGIFGPATINTAGKLIAANSFAIAGNGSEGKGGYTINITGGEVTSTGAPAVYHPNEGTVNISGGIITGTSAVYQKSGELNITGGTLKATGEKTEYSFNGNGANATGDAVVIDNCGYPGGAPVPNISGGTFESANAEAVASYAYTAEGAAEENEPVEGFVSGGSFNTEIPESYAAEGMIPAVLDEETGTYTVVEGAKITVEDIAALTFNGFEQKPVLVVKCGTDTLTEDDYSVEYAPKTGDANAQVGANGLPVNAGTYTATIKGLGEYKTAESDTVIKEVTVNAADINDADVKLTPESFVFENGGSFEPTVEVTIGEVPTQYVLKANTDYTLTYKDNDKAGNAKAVVTPVSGGNFKGEAKESPYTISSAVAKIGDTHYATLEAAVEAAKAGDTITIEADIEAASYVEVKKSLTIDLAGNTISRNGNALLNPMGSGVTLTVKDSVGGGSVESNIPVWVEDNAAFVLESGAIESKSDKDIAVYSDGTDITINGGTVTGGRYGVYGESGSAIEINDGTVTGKYNAIYAEHATEVTVNGGKVSTSEKSTFTISLWGNNGSLTVNGGTIEATGDDSVAISDNGNNAKSDITINGGTITSAKDIAIYKPAAGTLTVKGGTITGGTGIYVKSGNLVIPADSTAKITGNGEAKDYAHSGNGALSTGDAVVIENCSYPGGAPKADIKGGTFESENAQAAASYAWTEDGAAEENEPVEQFITGGTFKSPAAGSEAAITAAAAEGMVAVPVDDDTYGIGTLDVTVDSDANTAVAKAKIGSDEYTAANITAAANIDIDGIKDLKSVVEGMLEDGMTFGSDISIGISVVEKSASKNEAVFDAKLVAEADDTSKTTAVVGNADITAGTTFTFSLDLSGMGAKKGQFVNIKHESEGYETTNVVKDVKVVESKPVVEVSVMHFSTFTVTPAESEDAVASITNDGTTIYYATFEDAVDAAGEDDIITILKDIEVTSYVEITKSVTIDLAGNTISRDGNALLNPMGNGVTLTVKDSVGGGSVESGTPVWVGNGAAFVLESGTIKSIDGFTAVRGIDASLITVNGGEVIGGTYAMNIDGATKVVVNDGKVSTSGESSFTIALLGDNGSLTVNGGIIEATGDDSVAISDNGNNAKSDITINGGTITSAKDIAIYKPAAGTLTVKGGTITGGTGIYVKSGDLVIPADSTAKITGNGEAKDYAHSGNGALSTGEAVVIENCSYPGGAPTADIKGGVFESVNAETIASYAWTEEGASEENEPLENFVTGGAFVGDDIDEATLPEGKTLKKSESDGLYRIVDEWTVTFDSDGGSAVEEQKVADGDKAVKPADDPTKDNYVFDKWTLEGEEYDFDTAVTKDITLKATWKSAAASITKDDATTYYTTLADAVAAAKAGDTVKLLADVTETLTIDKDLDIDLGGKKLTIAPEAMKVTAGEVTITNGTIESDVLDAIEVIGDGTKLTVGEDLTIDTSQSTFYVQNKAELVIDGADISTDGQYVPVYGDGGSKITVKSGTVTSENTSAIGVEPGTLQISGGTINGGRLAAVYGIGETTEITITGGTINGGSQAVQATAGAKATISDGTFTADGRVIGSGYAAGQKPAEVTISGGTFTGASVKATNGSTIAISGGTFNVDEVTADDAKDLTVTGGAFKNDEIAKASLPEGKTLKKSESDGLYRLVDEWTVTFDSDGGSAVEEQKVADGDKASKPADPTKENNDFIGWTLDGEAYDFDTAVTKDITLKAAWDEIFAKKGDEKYYSAEDAIAAFEEEAVLEILSDEMSDITVPEINGTVKNGTLQTIKVNGVDVAPGESYNPAKAKIEADIEDLKDVVEDLQDQIDDLQDQIDALDDTYATDEDVADKIAAAKEAIETAQAAVDAAQDVELEENVEALEKAIEDAVAALEAADEATLEAAKAYTDEVAVDLQDKIDDLQDQIDALDDTYATDDQVAAAIEEAKAAIEAAQKAIDDAQDKALEDSVAELTAAIEAAKDAAEAADAEVLAAAKAYTDEAVADLQSQIDELNETTDSLQDQIDKLDDTYATDADVADKIAAAKEAIEAAQAAVDAAQDKALADSVADLTAAIREAKDAAAAADEEVLEAAKAYTDQVAGQLQDQIDGLQDQLDKLDDTFATDQDVADKIAAAREAIEAAQKAKDDLQDAKIEELEDAILNIVIDVQEAQKAVDEAQDAKIAALEARLTGAESQLAALKAEITQNNLNSISVSLKAAVSDYKTIKLSWNTTKITLDGKAVTYEIFYKKGSSKTWNKLLSKDCNGDGKRMTYTFKNLDTGTKYQFYAVPTTVFNGEQYVGSESTVVSAKPLPSRVVTTGITAGKQKFTIKFKKVKGATGYQIGYRDWTKVKENFKLVKGSTSVISKTITKLVSKHKYTARVRAYRLVNGKKVYGKWSKIRRVQVK